MSGGLPIVCLSALSGCHGQATAPVFEPRLDVGEPDLMIGSEDGPGPVFGTITDVIVRPDGSLLVADRVGAQVWHLNGAGEPISVFGGPGAGPGEFATPTELAWLSEDEYVVLDVDRFKLTVVKVGAAEQSYAGEIGMRFQALHVCASRGDIVLDPFTADFALVRIDRGGSVLATYHALDGPGDPGLPPESAEYVRERMGIGIPVCMDEGEVDFVPEWGAVARGFDRNGDELWAHELRDHLTLGWTFGDSPYPQVSLPPEGWVHHAVSAHRLDGDLLMVQFQEYGEGKGGRVDDPTEVRLIRPSDGAEARFERSLPTLAHADGPESWWWSNLPYPRLLRMSLRVSQARGGRPDEGAGGER